MPLYEFRCPSGHNFEKFYRSIGAAQSEAPCPECGEIAARLMSAAGLVFKGSRFYITDYGKDGKKAEREAAKAPATADKPAEKAGTEAAPAAPAPASKETPAPAAKPADASPKPAAAKAKSE